MILRRIFPDRGEPVDLDEPGADERLSALYTMPGRSWLRLNLIASVDGSAVGPDGTSESLSNPADRRLLGLIRRTADVVLVGAASVRAEGYRLPRGLPLAVITSSGDLSGHRIVPRPGSGPLLVLCPASAVSAVRRTLGEVSVDVVPFDDAGGRLDMTTVIATLHASGLPRVVCEGGPSLAAQLLDAGLVSELCLSTSAGIGGDPLPLVGRSGRRRGLELVQLLADDHSGLYARWAVSAAAAPAQPT
ncbi:MAG TPA: dihydrofolate reductase family protein [Lacisediminihabitans sp.]|uniref:dihydrofolate reductase family protein n=1 Tax=Lacisediminihabitans sp. TaxID=2787631 RepID=UPI002EDB1F6F